MNEGHIAETAINKVEALEKEVKDLKQALFSLSNTLYQLSQDHGDHVNFSTEVVEELDEIRLSLRGY